MDNVANILASGASAGMSREFSDLIKNIGDARTRQEEERHMVAEKARLKAKIGQPNVSTVCICRARTWPLCTDRFSFRRQKQMREYLVRVMYLEMLGHDASFGYIYAVNMAQQGRTPMEKRVGYLAVSLLLHENHELVLLLGQTILRDLKSSNYLDISSAMSALCRLINAEMVPVVYRPVVEKLSHPKCVGGAAPLTRLLTP